MKRKKVHSNGRVNKSSIIPNELIEKVIMFILKKDTAEEIGHKVYDWLEKNYPERVKQLHEVNKKELNWNIEESKHEIWDYAVRAICLKNLEKEGFVSHVKNGSLRKNDLYFLNN